MKILRIEFKNIKLYKNDLVIDLIATERVTALEEVNKIFNIINCQKVISITGLNATGKTTTLRLMNFVFQLLSDNTILQKEDVEFSLFKENSEVIVDFLIDNKMYRLRSLIGVKQSDNHIFSLKKQFYYKNEYLYKKNVNTVKKKTDILSWSEENILFERIELTIEKKSMLKFNHSMVSLVSTKATVRIIPFIEAKDYCFDRDKIKIERTLIKLFDDSIEYEKDKKIPLELLSSGTMRGSLLLTAISNLFSIGSGYIIVDDLEMNMNTTIVQFIIELFMDSRINKYGSVLIFTTHNVGILDSINRKDSIYVVAKDKEHKLKLDKYSSVIKRNDVRTSEILISNYFGSTAPSYEKMQSVKRLLLDKIKQDI